MTVSGHERKRHRVGTAVMLAAALCAAVLTQGCARQERKAYSEPEEWFYQNCDSGLRPVYDAFRKAAEDPFGTEAVPILSGAGLAVSFTISQTDAVYQGFLYDHPEMFWLTGSYDYHAAGNKEEEMADAVAVIPFAGSPEELESMKAAFESAASELLSGIPDEESDREKAAQIYRRLTEDAEYEEDALYDPSFAAQHSAYGAICEKRAVCDGFALAFKYLLNRKGIPCLVVPGSSFGEAHTWNTAFWEGAWHEADPTWEICSDESGTQKYFDLTTEEMNRDHRREESITARLIPVTPD